MKKHRKMRWTLGILAVLVVGVGVAWCATRPNHKVAVASAGRLERYADFKSKHISPRTVTVWLPQDYRAGEPCDVLYMHDGQMLFDAEATWNGQEWAVDETLSTLIAEHAIRRCIVVGIDNTSARLKEYFPDKARDYISAELRDDASGDQLGDEYLRFIVEELKPFIDEHYRPLTTREHTFMAGSSMGGLISLYALCEYPQVFGGVACLSSHLSFAMLNNGASDEAWAAAFPLYVAEHLPPANGSLVYMDHGTEDFDEDYGRYQEVMDAVFASHGWDSAHYMSRVYDGDGHNETCWAKRFGQPLRHLLSPATTAP